jgi:hypothetical protein
MGKVYRGKFLGALTRSMANKTVVPKENTDAQGLINELYKRDWIVYAKAPFGGPQAVIEYLGRYTHKVAISNHRIVSIDGTDGSVAFSYKDYADEGKQKQMALSSAEFIRRFAQHILPRRFTKIRTYGYLGNRNRHQRINEVLKKMKLPLHKGLVKIPLQLYMTEKYGLDIIECPCCKGKTMELIHIYYPWKRTDDG